MTIGVLGTGTVGGAIAGKLVELGHEVMMGSRERGNEKARAWAGAAGGGASEGSFTDAAAFGELVVNCTAGAHSLEALEQAGHANLAGKVLIDVANPLDVSGGMPPTLTVANTDSPRRDDPARPARHEVVKAFNTMNREVMVEPAKVPGDHDVFLCGEDEHAKQQVTELLESFGWSADHNRDLGGISSARGTEMYLRLWLRLFGALGTGYFNIKVVQ